MENESNDVINQHLTALMTRINELLQESTDTDFNIYLNRLRDRAASDVEHIFDYSAELERNYTVYIERNTSNAQTFSNPVNPADAQKQIFPWEEKKHTAHHAEFTVASLLLGFFGGIFILTALILFCINFMTDFVMGMVLYAVCILVFLVSEFVFFKNLPKLSITLSTIAVGAFYVVNGVNCFKWHNINIAEAILLCAAASLVNICFAVFRKKTSHTAIVILNMLCNLIFVLIIFVRDYLAVDMGIQGDYFANVNITVLAAGAIGIFVLLFVAECFMASRFNAVNKACYTTTAWGVGFLITFIISAILYYLMLGSSIGNRYDLLRYPFSQWAGEKGDVMLVILTAIMGLIVFLIMHALKLPQKWWVYYITLLFANAFYLDSTLTGLIILAVMLVVSRLLIYVNPAIRYSDIALTGFAFLAVIFEESTVNKMIAFGALLIGILLVKYFKTFNELLFAGAAVYLCYTLLPAALRLPVVVGTLFVGMFVFNTIERYRDKFIAVFNIAAFAVMFVCYIALINPVYRNSYITYIGMLVFGLATLVIMLTDRYNMHVKIKSLIVAVFATYMAVIFKSSYPILNSIFLMVIALVCVAYGFISKEMKLRIFGLSLSLITCIKLSVYDFRGVSVMQRTILFFTVGIIALIIAGIYIILERRYFKDSNVKEGHENTDGH